MFEIVLLVSAVWIGVIIAALGVAGDEVDGPAAAMVVFWPVTLPILAFFGFFYAIWSCFRLCLGWFANG